MDELAQLPSAIWVLVGLSVLAIIWALVDLARHDVKQLPRAAWAAIIIFVSFPIGVILYFAVGRVAGPRASANLPSSAPTGASSTGASSTVATARTASTATFDLDDAEPASMEDAGDSIVVATSQLSKVYSDDTWALRDVNLQVPRGATYGLIGPNGAGKTTMLAILAGLRRASAGSVTMNVDRSQVAVMVDTPLFEPWLTAREVVSLAKHLTARDLPAARIDHVLERVGLAAAADRRTEGFSRGMLQRLGLAAALVGDPQVLILDEPSSALDPAGRREVLDLIGELSGAITIMLSTHVLADVQQVCDTVGVIDHGELKFQGPIGDLLARTSTVYAAQIRGDATALMAQLDAQPWVAEVTVPSPGRLRIMVTDASEAERRIPAIVADANVALASFTPATDLETAFLELTR